MAFVFWIVVFFIDHYCAGVSNKYCLFQFSFLLLLIVIAHFFNTVFFFLGGALLGNLLTSVITIAKSDYPNGRFGFKGQLDDLDITLNNDATQQLRMLTVERTGGLVGQQTVCFRENPKNTDTWKNCWNYPKI